MSSIFTGGKAKNDGVVQREALDPEKLQAIYGKDIAYEGVKII